MPGDYTHVSSANALKFRCFICWELQGKNPTNFKIHLIKVHGGLIKYLQKNQNTGAFNEMALGGWSQRNIFEMPLWPHRAYCSNPADVL